MLETAINRGKVSYIVPVYNKEKYIGQCLDSLLSTTYPNIEIIIVDDGSTDESVAIISEYVSNRDNLIVVRQENGGVSKARNAGLKRVSGEFFQFVDADDVIDPEMPGLLVNYASQNDLDIVFCGYSEFEDINTAFFADDTIVSKTTGQIITEADQWKYLFEHRLISNVGSKMYRTETFRLKVAFDEKSSHFEDMMFCLDCISHSNREGYIPLPLYHYRRNVNDSLSYYIKEDDQINLLKLIDSADNLAIRRHDIPQAGVNALISESLAATLDSMVNNTKEEYISRCHTLKMSLFSYQTDGSGLKDIDARIRMRLFCMGKYISLYYFSVVFDGLRKAFRRVKNKCV